MDVPVGQIFLSQAQLKITDAAPAETSQSDAFLILPNPFSHVTILLHSLTHEQ